MCGVDRFETCPYEVGERLGKNRGEIPACAEMTVRVGRGVRPSSSLRANGVRKGERERGARGEREKTPGAACRRWGS